MEHDRGKIQCYKLSPAYRLPGLVGYLFLGGFSVVAILLCGLQPGEYPPRVVVTLSLCLLPFVALSLHGGVALMRVRLEFDERGLRNPGGPWLEWNEIACLVTKRARLECSDARQTRKARIDYRLTNFDVLAARVLDNFSGTITATLHSPYTASTVPKWTQISEKGAVPFAMFGLVMALGGYYAWGIATMLLSAALVAQGFLSERRKIRNIEVADQSIYVLRKNSVEKTPLDADLRVELRSDGGPYQVPQIVVVLSGDDGELARFPTKELDAIHLYYYLRNVINQEKARAGMVAQVSHAL